MIVLQIYGARPIRRWLEKNVVTELSKMLMREEIDGNSVVEANVAPDGLGLLYQVEKIAGNGNYEKLMS